MARKRFNKFQSRESSSSEDPIQQVSALPPEIIFDILIRLPVESLLRCKSVCKSWYSLISDPGFIKSHLSLSTSNNHYAHHRLVFTTTQARKRVHTCPLYDVLHDKYYVSASDHGNPLDDLDLGHMPSLLIAGSCNGLVCVVAGSNKPIIWNPGTRRWYRLSYAFDCSQFRYVCYGFGYDESSHDYKVVLISSAYNFKNEVKIYSLKTGIWKKTCDFPYGFPMNDSGKFSNGALHWVANGWTIVSIDLANETYGEVLQLVYDKGDRDLTLGVLGECLCVLYEYGGSHADVWVMKVYGVKDSWTKMVSIPYMCDPGRDRFSTPLVISNDGKVLLRLGSELTVYDSKTSSFSKIRNFVDCLKENTCYVESLVSPPVRWNLRKRRIR